MEAEAFLASLHDEQRAVATYDFSDKERYRWQYTPGSRHGLCIAAMDPAQREHAMRLVDAGQLDDRDVKRWAAKLASCPISTPSTPSCTRRRCLARRRGSREGRCRRLHTE